MSIGSTLMDAQRQGLEMVTEVQDRVIKANKEMAHQVTGMVDTLPLPDLKMPAVFDADFVGQAYEMTAEWLENSRKFTEELVSIWMPEAPKPKAAKK